MPAIETRQPECPVCGCDLEGVSNVKLNICGYCAAILIIDDSPDATSALRKLDGDEIFVLMHSNLGEEVRDQQKRVRMRGAPEGRSPKWAPKTREKT